MKQGSIMQTTVETRYGKIRGTELSKSIVWKGIPYAQPLAGPLRFQPPQPPEPWTGTRDATEFSPIAPQPILQEQRLSQIFTGKQGKPPVIGEDCLTLNIWAPQDRSQKHPVMVWIHGGAFVSGSGSTPLYDGESLATEGDVVVVTINYRLGAPGFLYLENEGQPQCNRGLLDQIAALRWVQENIAAFGGDPDNVTVFGESAGAMSIGTLLAMPAARGLFHQAILQSGASHAVSTKEQAVQQAGDFWKALGKEQPDLNALAELPFEEIIQAQVRSAEGKTQMSYQPVIDGVTLPQAPIDAVASGSAREVSLLIGTNRDEWKLFEAMQTMKVPFNEEIFAKAFGAAAPAVQAAYTADQRGETPAEVWSSVQTDRIFRIPAIRLAERQIQHSPVWMYRFDWVSPVLYGRLGACHGLEIPFVWNTIEKAAALTGNTSDSHALGRRMRAAWIAFAHTGSPEAEDLPHWPRYDLERRATMIFNTSCAVIDDPEPHTRALWERLM